MTKNFNINHYNKCPICGGNNATVIELGNLFNNIRWETVRCGRCESIFRVHYKVCDVDLQIVQNNAQQPQTQNSVPDTIFEQELGQPIPDDVIDQ